MYFDKFWISFDVCPRWYQLYQYKYYRRFGSVQHERRRYDADNWLGIEYGCVLTRGARSPDNMNSWSFDKVATCKDSRSWKKLYKVNHQWEKPKYQDENYYEITKRGYQYGII